MIIQQPPLLDGLLRGEIDQSRRVLAAARQQFMLCSLNAGCSDYKK
jgi:hypothetical protein